MKDQGTKKVPSNKNVSQKTDIIPINVETPSTSKDKCANTSTDNYTHRYDTSEEVDKNSSTSIRDVYSPSELRQMSPVTSHVTPFASSTPRLSRGSGKMILYIHKI